MRRTSSRLQQRHQHRQSVKTKNETVKESWCSPRRQSSNKVSDVSFSPSLKSTSFSSLDQEPSSYNQNKDIKPSKYTPSKRRRIQKDDFNGPSKLSQSETIQKKIASLRESLRTGPFPSHLRPTPKEAEQVAWLLAEAHGYLPVERGGQGLPKYEPPKGDEGWGGCGKTPSVLDAAVRTILSCNTSGANSERAHKTLCERFGHENWQGILDAPLSDVEESIRCGGLAQTKARTIQNVLRETLSRHGHLSLDHLHTMEDTAAMEELVSFHGIGPKVASCVLAFCIGRANMAVDTHVWRLTKQLGWVPTTASRDQTYYHLHERVPDHLKYPLHVLLIQHGRTCIRCSARKMSVNASIPRNHPTTSNEDTKSPIKNEEKPDTFEKVNPTRVLSDKYTRSVLTTCPLMEAGLLGNRRTVSKIKDEASESP